MEDPKHARVASEEREGAISRIETLEQHIQELERQADVQAAVIASSRRELERQQGRSDALNERIAAYEEEISCRDRQLKSLQEKFQTEDSGNQFSAYDEALKDKIANSHDERTRPGHGLKQKTAVVAELTARRAYFEERARSAEQSLSRMERRLLKLTPAPFSNGFGEAPRLISLLRYERASLWKLIKIGSRAFTRVGERDSPFSWLLYFHYRVLKRRKDAKELLDIARSGFFHTAFYLRHSPDVFSSGVDPLLHYMDKGAAELRDPSPLFITKTYIERNPEIARSGMNPLSHFVRKGRHGDVNSGIPNSIEATVAVSDDDRSAVTISNKTPRIVIYTALVGNYELLQPVTFRPPGCDFVVFSDRPIDVAGWEYRPINYIHNDPARSARFAKLHPHIYFEDYDYSLWIDVNIRIRDNIADFIAAVSHDSYLAAFDHPYRSCVYDEVAECVKRHKDKAQILNEQRARYKNQRYPKHAGLWETGVLARRHNDPQCIRFMREWWREIELGSRRDQISLPVVRKRLNATIKTLGWPGDDLRHDPRLSFVPHMPALESRSQSTEIPKPLLKEVDLSKLSLDIGICVHNSPDVTRQAFESALLSRGHSDRIIIVDDGSAPETAAMLDEFVKTHERVLLIRNEACRGYTSSANAIFQAARGDWVVMLNSDAVLSANSLRKLIICGEQFDNLAVIGPMSNAASWQTVPVLENADDGFCVNAIPENLTIENLDSFCEEETKTTPIFTPLVNGFCFAVRRSVIDAVGMFDETTFPMGYGEEDDFCLRVADAGYVCGIATNTYVFHHKSATFQHDRRKAITKLSGQALRLKHGPERIARAMQMLRDNPELMRMRARIAERQGILAEPTVSARSQNPIAVSSRNDEIGSAYGT